MDVNTDKERLEMAMMALRLIHTISLGGHSLTTYLAMKNCTIKALEELK